MLTTFPKISSGIPEVCESSWRMVMVLYGKAGKSLKPP